MLAPSRQKHGAGTGVKRLVPPLLTLLIFVLIFRRIPFARFLEALAGADYARFVLLMFPNGLFFFAWDTLILTVVIRWLYAPLRFRDLLPVRAVSYVVSLMNTNLARATMAYYLTRQLRAPFFELAGTVLFLTLLEMTHLALWASAGILAFHSQLPTGLLWVPLGLFLFWTGLLLSVRFDIAPWRAVTTFITAVFPRLHGRGSIREWAIFRPFVQLPLYRYGQVILLRAPLFFLSLVFHFLAVKTFGMDIPLLRMMTFLPIIFMLGALPITVAHLGTTQAAWIFFFRDFAPAPQLLAYSLASHLAFMLARATLGLVFLPRGYRVLFGALLPERLPESARVLPLRTSTS